eukprot:1838800-Pyramimonas_sp.AAC.2
MNIRRAIYQPSLDNHVSTPPRTPAAASCQPTGRPLNVVIRLETDATAWSLERSQTLLGIIRPTTKFLLYQAATAYTVLKKSERG